MCFEKSLLDGCINSFEGNELSLDHFFYKLRKTVFTDYSTLPSNKAQLYATL